MYKKSFPTLSNTLICETPHGFHLYYKTKECAKNNTSSKNGGYTAKKFIGINTIKFGKWLKGFDSRANGGFVVIPPSKVDNQEYKWLTEREPCELSLEEYDKIVEFFKENDSISHTMRSGFVDVLNGKINPQEYKIKLNKEEHVYWKETYHEAYCCCGLLPEDLLEGLEKLQKGYDPIETEIQLKNSKNREYILDEKRLTTELYNEYFPGKKPPTKEEFLTAIEGDRFELKGRGNIVISVGSENGLFLEKIHPKSIEYYQILEGFLELKSICYETLNQDRLLLNGIHDKREFRTMPMVDLLNRLRDYIYQGSMGLDIVKKFIHIKRRTLPVYDVSYVLGFNSHWNLPFLEEERKTLIFTATDKQQDAYNKAKSIYVKYTDEQKIKIKKLMFSFINITKTETIKLSIIIGWCMAAPFRQSFIDTISLFPILLAHGKRTTGKSSLIDFFGIRFYGIHERYSGSQLLYHISQLEDKLSMGSFPVFVEEVVEIPLEALSIIKEHGTGTSDFFRKKGAREKDFECLKSAALAMDCNNIPEALSDPATVTKILTVPFGDEDTIEIDESWVNLRSELYNYKLFSLLYDYTKDWTDKTIKDKISFYMNELITLLGKKEKGEIERDNPRLTQHYIVVAFGIDLFNEVFGTKFDRKLVLNVMIKGRILMTEFVLDDFFSFCQEAINYDPMGEGKKPFYLNHSLDLKISTKKGGGYLFDAALISDFNQFTKGKYKQKDLLDKLKDALPDKLKELVSYHRTGQTRGIWIDKRFFELKSFDINEFEKEDKKITDFNSTEPNLKDIIFDLLEKEQLNRGKVVERLQLNYTRDKVNNAITDLLNDGTIVDDGKVLVVNKEESIDENKEKKEIETKPETIDRIKDFCAKTLQKKEKWINDLEKEINNKLSISIEITKKGIKNLIEHGYLVKDYRDMVIFDSTIEEKIKELKK